VDKGLTLPPKAQTGAPDDRCVPRRIRVLHVGWTLWTLGTVWMCINIMRLALAGSSIPFSWAHVLKLFTDLQCLAGGACTFAGAIMIAIGRAFVSSGTNRVDLHD